MIPRPPWQAPRGEASFPVGSALPFKAPPLLSGAACQGFGALTRSSNDTWPTDVSGPPLKKLRTDIPSGIASIGSRGELTLKPSTGDIVPNTVPQGQTFKAVPGMVHHIAATSSTSSKATSPQSSGLLQNGKGASKGGKGCFDQSMPVFSKAMSGPAPPMSLVAKAKGALPAGGMQSGYRHSESMVEAERLEAETKRQKEEEEKRQQEEAKRRQEETKRQQEVQRRLEKEKQAAEEEAVAAELQRQLTELFEAATPVVKEAKDKGEAVQELGKDVLDEEILRCIEEFDLARTTAKASLKPCFDFMVGKHRKMQGSKEETKNAAVKLITSLQQAARSVDGLHEKIVPIGKQAKARRDAEQRRLAAIEEEARQRKIFKSYDVDGDDLLCATEIEAYVKDEYGFELPEGRAAQMLLNSASFKEKAGAPYDKFPQLKMLIGVAKDEHLAKIREREAEERKVRVAEQMAEAKQALATVTEAISGIEAEVVKAEQLVQPLAMMRGRLTMASAVVEDRTATAESAIEAAKDFIGAARDQAVCLGKDKDTVEPEVRASPEARKVAGKLDWYDSRLSKAAQVTKFTREKLELQKRKALLLQEVEGMPQKP